MTLARYNQSRAPGATEKIVASFAGGINKYNRSIGIQDNQMSGAENFISTDGSSVKGFVRVGYAQYHWDQMFAYYGGIHLSSGVEIPYSLTTESRAIDSHAASLILASDNTPSIASLNWHCSILYRTNAVNFIRATDSFSCYSNEASASILKFDNSKTDETGAALVTPPGTNIRSMALHLNRLFIIDTSNMLWWCQLLDPTTWYAGVTTDSYVYEDAGFAKISGSDQIRQLVSFRDALYLFGEESIWVLSGGEPDQFQLQRVVSGVGIGVSNNVCIKDNVMYFIDDNLVYEFNGSNPPNLISHPIISGDNSVNGVAGGFLWSNPRYTATDGCYELTDVAADDDFLYVFGREVNSDATRRVCWMYLFDFRRRTWFRLSVFPHATNFYVFHNVSRLGVLYWGVSTYASGPTYLANDYATSGMFTTTVSPFNPGTPDLGWVCKFITKAFSAYPSMNSTLSDIYIICRPTGWLSVLFSDVPGPANATTYTTDVDISNFTLLKTFDAPATPAVTFTALRVQIPHSFTKAMAPFFRIAILSSGYIVEIHAIEFRYRIKGVVR